jgi:hypothetical protein
LWRWWGSVASFAVAENGSGGGPERPQSGTVSSSDKSRLRVENPPKMHRAALGESENLKIRMVDKQSEADKARAIKEYDEAPDAAIQRIATLRAARLARDAAATPTKTKGAKASPK